jgi:ribose/xylose/arabinose/galactoside ABC-type transport system permease subunit
MPLELSTAFNAIKKATRTSPAIIGVLGIGIILSFASDRFLSVYNLMNVVRQISIEGIMAAAMTYVIISAGIDLSVGAVLAFSGVFAVRLMSEFGINMWLSIAAALLAGLFFGLINGFCIAHMNIPPFIATLGMMSIVRGTSYLYTGGQSITCTVESFRSIGNGYLGPIPLPVIYMLLFYAVLILILSQTRYGRYLIAVGGSEEAARLSGIRIPRTKIIAYSLTGLSAALSGVILASRLGSGQPIAGLGSELNVIAAVVLGGTTLAGGRGTVWGSLVGALLIGVLNNGLNLLGISFFYQQVVGGFVIILAVFINSKTSQLKRT